MANILEGWVDKVDGIDDVKAADVNSLANAIKQLGALGYLSPYPNTTTGTWWGINATTGQYQDTKVKCAPDISELTNYVNQAKNYAESIAGVQSEVEGYKSEFKGAIEIAKGAKGHAENAELNAFISKSYAVGGTGKRVGEDSDNAKHYASKAKEVSEYHMSRIVTNIRTLMNKYSLIYPSLNYSVNIDYNDLNRLERILEIVYENILSIVRSWHLYSGACIAGGCII